MGRGTFGDKRGAEAEGRGARGKGKKEELEVRGGS